MKLPRDLSGDARARLPKSFGYETVRQTGSHMRLTTREYGDHHITIPRHDALRIGIRAGILADVAEHAGIRRDDVAIRLLWIAHRPRVSSGEQEGHPQRMPR